MAYPTSVHQLKIPEPYLICLAQDCRTNYVPLSFFLSSSLPDIHRGQRTFPDMHLQRCPFLILLSHPSWAVSFTLLTLMEFMMFFFLLSCENRTCFVHSPLSTPPMPPAPLPCSLPFVQGVDYTTLIPALHKSWKILGLNLRSWEGI